MGVECRGSEEVDCEEVWVGGGGLCCVAFTRMVYLDFRYDKSLVVGRVKGEVLKVVKL